MPKEEIKKGQSRGNQKGTVQRKSKRDSPEAIKKGQSRGNQKGTVQRQSKRDGPEEIKKGQRQHRVHKTKADKAKA